jgi:pilus assembly protein Flp/PilA
VTEELARDFAVLLAGAGRAPRWLHHGHEAELSIELPSFEGCAPRVLECGSVITRLESLAQGFRIRLNIYRRAFLVPAGEKSASLSSAACRDREVTKTSTQLLTMERGKQMRFLKNLVNEESGQDMVEYGLVVALIALAVIAGITTFGTNLQTGFTSMNGKIASNVK